MTTDERRARAEFLREKIQKLPILDLQWPKEMQDIWWKFVETFYAEIKDIKNTYSGKHDKRRETAICVAFSEWFVDKTTENRPWLHERLARAIRTSDEAAGMVLVPREALERIAEGRTCTMLTSLPPDCQRAHWARELLAAATEADNG